MNVPSLLLNWLFEVFFPFSCFPNPSAFSKLVIDERRSMIPPKLVWMGLLLMGRGGACVSQLALFKHVLNETQSGSLHPQSPTKVRTKCPRYCPRNGHGSQKSVKIPAQPPANSDCKTNGPDFAKSAQTVARVASYDLSKNTGI